MNALILIRFAEDITEVANPFETVDFTDFFQVLSYWLDQYSYFVEGVKKVIDALPQYLSVFMGIYVVTVVIMLILCIVAKLL